MCIRNLFLTCFCFVLFTGGLSLNPNKLFGQTYQHYLNNTSTWFEMDGIVQWPIPSCPYGGTAEWFTRYHIVDSTVILGEQWYKVHRDQKYVRDCMGAITTSYTSFNPDGFLIREDSTGKIWHKENGSAPELAYDFGPSYNLGDTIIFNDGLSRMVVDSIDHVFLGNEQRTRWWGGCISFGTSNNYLPEFIIEGIGFSIGLRPTYFDLCDPSADTWKSTICWMQNGYMLIMDPNETCGDPPHIPYVSINPSFPTHNLHWLNHAETVSLEGREIMGEYTYKVYDLSGKVLRQGSSTESLLHLPGLAEGFYLVEVQIEGQQILEKFVRY